MPPKSKKAEKIELLAKKLSSSKGIYLTDFTGMDVSTASLLRRKLKEADVDYMVVKNTLARLAAKQEGFDMLVAHLEGPTGLAIANKDEVSPARILSAFRKEHETPRVKLAFVEGNLIQEKQINVLAGLPSKDVLLGQLAGAFKKPVFVLGFYLQNAVRQLLAGLDALARQKETQKIDGGVQENPILTKAPEVTDGVNEQT